MELASSPQNMLFGSREKTQKAEAEFYKLHSDKAQRYTAREQGRIYRDPDGVINPWRDPAIQTLRESDNRHQIERWDLSLQRFSKMYPDKTKAYATVIPELNTMVSVTDGAIGTKTSGPEIGTPIAETHSEEPEDHATEANAKANVIELKLVNSTGDIPQAIQKQIPLEVRQMSDEELDQRRQALVERPVIGSATLKDAVIGASEQPKFVWIQTDKIVGITPNVRPGGWSSEEDGRKGRIINVAKAIINSHAKQDYVEDIFHPGKSNERIIVTSISGPDGPIYLVDDGTHRVSGAMVAGLSEIPCDVKEIQYPLEQITPNVEEAQDWLVKIKLGLIDGSVEDYTSPNGIKLSRLSVRSEVVPWIRTYSQADLIKISRVYEQLYPGSLNKLKVPRDALVDPIANNYFMANKWQEWVDGYSQKPRDENGVVKYY